MKSKIGDSAVTEILSAMVLLAMAIAAFSVVYLNVVSDDGPGKENFVTIAGTIMNEDGSDSDFQEIIFEHNRGDSLDADTEVVLYLGDIKYDPPSPLTVGANPDFYQKWDIGERYVCYPTMQGQPIPLNNLRVSADIIDKETNSLAFWGTLQEGWTLNPYGFGGIWNFDETYYEYSGTDKDVLDSVNENDGIARGLSRHILANPSNSFNAPDDNNPDNVVSGLGSCFFPGILGSDVLIDNHLSLYIQDEITLDAWMKPLDSGYIRSMSDFNAKFAYNPGWVHVDGDIYAIVGEGKGYGPTNPAQQGLISTVLIEKDGNIEDIEINGELQVFEFDRPAYNPDIIKVGEDADYNFYAIVYTTENPYYGAIKIVKISKNTGEIDIMSGTPVSNFDSPVADPSIVHVENNLYAIAYSGEDNSGNDAGILSTVEIDPNDWSVTLKNSQLFTNPGYLPKIMHADGDLFIVVYTDESLSNQLGNGFVETFNIDATGDTTITQLFINSLDTSCNDPTIIQISNSVYAIAYRGIGNKGYINTITVNTDSSDSLYGSITKMYTNSIQFDDKAYSPDIISISSEDEYAIVYEGDQTGNPDGSISLVEITSSGTIDQDKIKSFTDEFYDPVDENVYPCKTPKFIPITDEVFAVVFRTSSVAPPHQGMICTFRLGEEDPSEKFKQGLFKSGSISVYADDQDIYASLVTEDGQEHNIELNYPNMEPDFWYHISLTFDGTTINVHAGKDINADGNILTSDGEQIITNSETISVQKKIKISTEDLKFGYKFFGYLDEISIKNKSSTKNELYPQS